MPHTTQSKQKWSWTDDLKVYKLYTVLKMCKFNKSISDIIIKQTATEIDKSVESVKMKLDNYKFLDTGEGLKNCSSRSKLIWEIME